MPLKKYLGITYFNYVRLDKDNERTLLTNRSKYISDFYERDRHKESNVVDIERLKRDKVFTWDQFQYELTFAEARQEYDIANGITIIKLFETHTELYYFGTEKRNQNACFRYQSNIDSFERFILHFKEKGRNLLNFASKHSISCPGTKNVIHSIVEQNLKLLADYDRFRFLYNNGSNKLFFSKEETRCAAYLILQFSTKEIAKIFRLSVKQVERYLTTIKKKLGCFSKQELIKKLLELDILPVSKVLAKTNAQGNNTSFKFHFYPSVKLHLNNFLEDTSINKLYLDVNKNQYITKQECICLFLLFHGYSAKIISRKMHCSFRTVETHIFNIYKKFGFHKKSELVFFCIKRNFLNSIIYAFPEVLKLI